MGKSHRLHEAPLALVSVVFPRFDVAIKVRLLAACKPRTRLAKLYTQIQALELPQQKQYPSQMSKLSWKNHTKSMQRSSFICLRVVGLVFAPGLAQLLASLKQ